MLSIPIILLYLVSLKKITKLWLLITTIFTILLITIGLYYGDIQQVIVLISQRVAYLEGNLSLFYTRCANSIFNIIFLCSISPNNYFHFKFMISSKTYNFIIYNFTSSLMYQILTILMFFKSLFSKYSLMMTQNHMKCRVNQR